MAVTLGDPRAAGVSTVRQPGGGGSGLRLAHSCGRNTAMLSVSFQGGTAAGQNSFIHLFIQQFFAEYLLCARH